MRNPWLYILALLICQACANQTQPTGGPKDETPPVLVESTPATGDRNVTTREFTLVFDEDVTLNDARNQLLITPRTSVDYEISYRKNEVSITFDSALDANTTYTFSYRESIVDVTEKNPAEKLQIAFSTGPELDTLMLEGTVQEALSGRYPDGATVVLYRESDTTNIFSGLPYYFTETSDSGRYSLKNLKAGTYRLYAINDYNANLKAETGSEPYAFHGTPVTIDTTNAPIHLRMVSLDLDSLRNLSARKSGSTFLVKYNKALVDFSLTSTDSLLAYMDPQDPTLLRVQTPEEVGITDSIPFSITATDSLGLVLTNEFFGTFEPASTRKEPFSITLTPAPVIVKNPVLRYKLKFSKPAKILNSDSLYVRIDSLHVYALDTTHLRWNGNQTELEIAYLFDKSLFQRQQVQDTSNTATLSRPRDRVARESPTFRIGTGAFISIEYDTISRREETIQFFTEQDVAAFILQLSNVPDYPVLIQFLVNETDITIERSVNQDGTYTFTNITPGTYTIRVVEDANGNGRWDPGNYFQNEQPERIHLITDESGAETWNLRANFEFQELLNLGVEK